MPRYLLLVLMMLLPALGGAEYQMLAFAGDSLAGSAALISEEDVEVGTESPILVMESPHSLEQTITNVTQAALGRNYRLIREQAFDQGLAPDGQESPHTSILHFCNFKFVKGALELDKRIGVFLPFRITVAQRDGRVLVMAVNPKRLNDSLFKNASLADAALKVYGDYVRILDEATF